MFKRLGNLVRGFFGLMIGGMEQQNPEALLDVEKENLRAQIGKYNEGLAAHAGLCERLMSQVKKLESEEADLKAKTSAHLRAGHRDAAGQNALRLQTVSRELAENRTQLEAAENTYQELVRARDVSVRAAQQKIEHLKSGLTDLKVKKAQAELTEMASGMVTEIGGAGDTLNRLQEMVEEERQKAGGRARVARDSLKASDTLPDETEQQALADQALADFAAREGIAMEGEIPAPEIKRSMGPETNS